MGELSDKYDFLEGLRKRPETLKTVLKEDYVGRCSTTKKFVAQRKIQSLFKDGFIVLYSLEGDVRNSKLFLHPEKEYSIVVTRKGRQGWNHYYCFGVEEKGEGILLKGAFVLDNTEWRSVRDLFVPFGEVVRCF